MDRTHRNAPQLGARAVARQQSGHRTASRGACAPVKITGARCAFPRGRRPMPCQHDRVHQACTGCDQPFVIGALLLPGPRHAALLAGQARVSAAGWHSPEAKQKISYNSSERQGDGVSNRHSRRAFKEPFPLALRLQDLSRHSRRGYAINQKAGSHLREYKECSPRLSCFLSTGYVAEMVAVQRCIHRRNASVHFKTETAADRLHS